MEIEANVWLAGFVIRVSVTKDILKTITANSNIYKIYIRVWGPCKINHLMSDFISQNFDLRILIMACFFLLFFLHLKERKVRILRLKSNSNFCYMPSILFCKRLTYLHISELDKDKRNHEIQSNNSAFVHSSIIFSNLNYCF